MTILYIHVYPDTLHQVNMCGSKDNGWLTIFMWLPIEKGSF